MISLFSGLHVTSTEDINVQYINFGYQVSDTTAVPDVDSLGTEYMVATYKFQLSSSYQVRKVIES